jgi:hypothetical protein
MDFRLLARGAAYEPTTAQPRAGASQAVGAGEPATAIEPVGLKPAARAFRIAHLTFGAFAMAGLAWIWICAVSGRRDRALRLATGQLLFEGGALIVGRGNCPFGTLQARLGDPVPMFELLLPPRAAKAAVPILAGITISGFAVLFVRGPR